MTYSDIPSEMPIEIEDYRNESFNEAKEEIAGQGGNIMTSHQISQ